MPDSSPIQNPRPIQFFGHFPKISSIYPTSNPMLWILAAIFSLNLLLVSPDLMPGFSQVNVYDETKYVESGRMLLKGELRSLSWGPLVGAFYAPLHLVVGDSPDWFLLETWIGRFLMFGLLWMSLVVLAFQLKEFASPYLMAGLLFVSIPFFLMFENQSDCIFTSLSIFALAQMIAFYHHKHIKSIWLASVFVGLGVLARVETVVLIGTTLVIAWVVGRQQYKVWKLLAAAILPAVLILAGLLAVNLLTAGDLNLGVSNKSYESFEVNQSILTGGDLQKGREEARRLFGTQEENNSSVLRAILRNPKAFTQRILANLQDVPWAYFYFFGKTQGYVLLLFAAWGGVALLRKRAWPVFFILLAWPLHAVIPLAFLARHVIPQTFYLPMILGVIGFAAAFAEESPRVQRIILGAAWVLSGLYSLLDHKPAFLFGSILVLAIYSIAWLVRLRPHTLSHVTLLSMLLLFAAGLILRDSYSFPEYPSLGKSDEELAVHYMQEALPHGTKVLSPFPLPVVAAKLVDVTTRSEPKSVVDIPSLLAWLSERDVTAAYVDSRYPINPNLTALLESGVGEFFEVSYTSPNQFVRVFLIK